MNFDIECVNCDWKILGLEAIIADMTCAGV